MATNPARRPRRSPLGLSTRKRGGLSTLRANEERNRVKRLLSNARPAVERREFLRQADDFLGPIKTENRKANELKASKRSKKTLFSFSRKGVLKARQLLREGETVFYEPEQVEAFKKKFSRRAKEQRLSASDVRSLRTGYRKSGAEIQTPFRLQLDFITRRLAPFDMSKDDFGDSTRSFLSRSNSANANLREMLVEILQRRKKTPAFIGFFVTALTPGLPARGIPRKMTSLPSPKIFRAQFSPQVPTERIIRAKEDLTMYLNRAFESAMRSFNTQCRQAYETFDYDEPWTILKVSIEVGFETKPTDRQLFTYLKREEKRGHIKRISEGRKQLNALKTRLKRK